MANFSRPIHLEDLPEDEFSVIPAGRYTAIAESVQIKQAEKNQNNEYLEIIFRIVGPTMAGRMIWHRVTIANENPKAEQIGRTQLRHIMTALGETILNTTEQIQGQVMDITVKIEKNPKDGRDSNKVTSVSKQGDAAVVRVPLPAATMVANTKPKKLGVPPFVADTKAPAVKKPAAPSPWELSKKPSPKPKVEHEVKKEVKQEVEPDAATAEASGATPPWAEVE